MTKIRNIYNTKTLHVRPGLRQGRVSLSLVDDDYEPVGNAVFPHDEVIKAVHEAAGESVILINESELPEVKPGLSAFSSGNETFLIQSNPRFLKERALEFLAAARYVESQQAKEKAEDEELDGLARDLFDARYENAIDWESPTLSSVQEKWRNVARKAKELLRDE